VADLRVDDTVKTHTRGEKQQSGVPINPQSVCTTDRQDQDSGHAQDRHVCEARGTNDAKLALRGTAGEAGCAVDLDGELRACDDMLRYGSWIAQVVCCLSSMCACIYVYV